MRQEELTELYAASETALERPPAAVELPAEEKPEPPSGRRAA